MRNSDLDWPLEAIGKVVIVKGLMTYVPSEYHYKATFVQRNLS